MAGCYKHLAPQERKRISKLHFKLESTLYAFVYDGEESGEAQIVEKKAGNSPDAPAPGGGYSQALEVRGHTRIVFVSGQIPETKDGVVPDDFGSQCRLVWQNLEAELRAADMSLGNIVKVTTFLSDRRYAVENSQIRQEVLVGCAPALTVIIAGIFDEKWLLEIEVIAAA